jgi:hypothetical protein
MQTKRRSQTAPRSKRPIHICENPNHARAPQPTRRPETAPFTPSTNHEATQNHEKTDQKPRNQLNLNTNTPKNWLRNRFEIGFFRFEIGSNWDQTASKSTFEPNLLSIHPPNRDVCYSLPHGLGGRAPCSRAKSRLARALMKSSGDPLLRQSISGSAEGRDVAPQRILPRRTFELVRSDSKPPTSRVRAAQQDDFQSASKCH